MAKKLSNPEKTIAEILAKGEVVALLQGKMEFGDRALGFRSILADPRSPVMKDKINGMIKYRESYRPFAPATLFECAHHFFDVEKGYSCNYMEKVVQIKKKYQEKIPAVTHFDGSGRYAADRARAAVGGAFGGAIPKEEGGVSPTMLGQAGTCRSRGAGDASARCRRRLI